MDKTCLQYKSLNGCMNHLRTSNSTTEQIFSSMNEFIKRWIRVSSTYKKCKRLQESVDEYRYTSIDTALRKHTQYT